MDSLDMVCTPNLDMVYSVHIFTGTDKNDLQEKWKCYKRKSNVIYRHMDQVIGSNVCLSQPNNPHSHLFDEVTRGTFWSISRGNCISLYPRF